MPERRIRPLRHDLLAQVREAHDEKRFFTTTNKVLAKRLHRAVHAGKLISPLPQVYALPSHWMDLKAGERHLYTVRALATLHPDWTFCSVSAAVVHGLSVSYQLLGNVHVATTRHAHSASRAGITRHIVDHDEFREVDGIRVTSMSRTAFDAIRDAGFRSGLALADSALRVGGMKQEQLMMTCGRFDPHIRNKQRALEIIALADPRAESGGESVARAVMIELGAMPPMLQVLVGDQVDHMEEYRADFGWHLPDDSWVLGELDGHEKYTNPITTKGRNMVQVLADERIRESRVSASGAKIMRFSFAEAVKSKRMLHLLRAYGVPLGYPIPEVALAG
ncbi:MAG: hypothetical protein IJ092_09630 [Atopobiaceae bacterium]|nr:hypothetical protein [Atopobiaceae bacterium]